MPTITHLPENPVIVGLQLAVAETYVLTTLTHNAHWNISGTDFFQLHAAFNDQYETLFDQIDKYAERIQQLQGLVKVNLADFVSMAKMPELVAPFDAQTAVRTLLAAREKAIADLKTLSEVSARANDLATQQIVLDDILVHQKACWQLRSYLK